MTLAEKRKKILRYTLAGAVIIGGTSFLLKKGKSTPVRVRDSMFMKIDRSRFSQIEAHPVQFLNRLADEKALAEDYAQFFLINRKDFNRVYDEVHAIYIKAYKTTIDPMLKANHVPPEKMSATIRSNLTATVSIVKKNASDREKQLFLDVSTAIILTDKFLHSTDPQLKEKNYEHYTFVRDADFRAHILAHQEKRTALYDKMVEVDGYHIDLKSKILSNYEFRKAAAERLGMDLPVYQNYEPPKAKKNRENGN